ncbi:MAG: hypothetical protein ACXV8O_01320 [Methylobacter sp.]
MQTEQQQDTSEFRITTGIDGTDGAIVQDVEHIINGEVVNSIQSIIDMKDEQVRKALIDLGWTPPAAIILPFKNSTN